MSLSALLRSSPGELASALASAVPPGDTERGGALRHAPSLNDFSLGVASELAAQDGACARLGRRSRSGYAR
jgi:hypothetical protein